LVRACTLLIVCGGVLLSVSMLGLTGWALASDPLVRLHVDSGRLTGQLTQVTLRAVLGQLHNQLGIDYVAPDAELGKVISVTLQKEPLSRALSKILAAWDYAFTLDAAGNIKTLYVTAKVAPETSLADMMAKGGRPESHEQKVSELQRHGWAGHGSGMRREDQLNKKASMSGLSTRERAVTSRKVLASLGASMGIRPPAPGTSMQILPANVKSMPISPGGSARAMEIIPPTAYPPMNIQPVPEHVQQEMLLPLSP
jgi:hypothetical protein